jgi:hypothetical protein
MDIAALEEMADRLRSGESCGDEAADMIDCAIGEIERLRKGLDNLRRELRDTRQAAIFSAVELLHRLGVSGGDAERVWMGELAPNTEGNKP